MIDYICEHCLRFIESEEDIDSLSCPYCRRPADRLPELTDDEKDMLERTKSPEFIDRIMRGERPLTDPTTFAN